MKRRTFIKLAGAFFVSALVPGGNWLEASAATEAVATTTGVGLPTFYYKPRSFFSFRAEHLNAGLYSATLPARVVKGGSTVTVAVGESTQTINFHDAPGAKK